MLGYRQTASANHALFYGRRKHKLTTNLYTNTDDSKQPTLVVSQRGDSTLGNEDSLAQAVVVVKRRHLRGNHGRNGKIKS